MANLHKIREPTYFGVQSIPISKLRESKYQTRVAAFSDKDDSKSD